MAVSSLLGSVKSQIEFLILEIPDSSDLRESSNRLNNVANLPKLSTLKVSGYQFEIEFCPFWSNVATVRTVPTLFLTAFAYFGYFET